MTNELGIRTLSLSKLQVGQSALLGPFKSARSVSTKINYLRKKNGCGDRKFVQRQLLVVDVSNGVVHKMCLVTRTG